jgi:hypothetical protein
MPFFMMGRKKVRHYNSDGSDSTHATESEQKQLSQTIQVCENEYSAFKLRLQFFFTLKV